MSNPRCRLCSSELRHTFVDLGMSPPCESYLNATELDAGETFYALHVRICENRLLVQLPAYIPAEDIFPTTRTSPRTRIRGWRTFSTIAKPRRSTSCLGRVATMSRC
jgi:Putative zinc binding domain